MYKYPASITGSVIFRLTSCNSLATAIVFLYFVSCIFTVTIVFVLFFVFAFIISRERCYILGWTQDVPEVRTQSANPNHPKQKWFAQKKTACWSKKFRTLDKASPKLSGLTQRPQYSSLPGDRQQPVVQPETHQLMEGDLDSFGSGH